MNEREMFEKSFERPANFFRLSPPQQWHVDDRLGLLDWNGDGLSEEDITRFKEHYKERDEER